MRVSTACLALAAFVTLGACGGGAGPGGGPNVVGGQTGQFLYTLLVNTTDPNVPPNSEVEIVNVDTLTRSGGFSLSGVWGASLVVSPDGTRLYIADRHGGQILVRSPQGADLGSIPLPGVYDLVLDGLGTRLWAASFTGPKIARYDALTLALGVSITPTGLGGGISLSPDGTKLAWPNFTGYGGAFNGCFLANAQTLAAPVPVPFAGAPCNTKPTEARFVTDARLVVWDSSCDRLHQVDVTTNSFLLGADVALGADAGGSWNFNNCLTSTSSARVHGIKESGNAWRVDPLVPSSTVLSGHTGIPVLVALTADEQALLVFSWNAPVKIDRMSTNGETFTNDVYTFTSTLPVARDAVTRFVGP